VSLLHRPAEVAEQQREPADDVAAVLGGGVSRLRPWPRSRAPPAPARPSSRSARASTSSPAVPSPASPALPSPAPP